MIGTDLTRFFALRAAEAQHYLDGDGDAGHRCAMDASKLEERIRSDLNAILAPHGATVGQIERMAQ